VRGTRENRLREREREGTEGIEEIAGTEKNETKHNPVLLFMCGQSKEEKAPIHTKYSTIFSSFKYCWICNSFSAHNRLHMHRIVC